MAHLAPLNVGEHPELQAGLQPTLEVAHRLGVTEDKLGQLLDYAASEVYSEWERGAMALAAARVPNETPPAHFVRLREHDTERQIVQLVGVIALFGFLNRWNDTMATELEAEPAAHAESVLSTVGWSPGKHEPGSGRV